MTAGPPSRPPESDRSSGPSLTAAPTGSRLHNTIGAARSGATDSEDAMRKHMYTDEEPVRDDRQLTADEDVSTGGLPNRLLTAFEVAEYIGCHEETVRRAYSRGLLTSQRFGVRGRRFHPADVVDWIKRGAPTRVS
jgi:excisionase family DNA binding protein